MILDEYNKITNDLTIVCYFIVSLMYQKFVFIVTFLEMFVIIVL